MSDTHTDLVIQLSSSARVPGSPDVDNEESRLVGELRRWLQPGVEVALTFHGFRAITSILWLSECEVDHSFRAGVRLLGVSALSEEEQPTDAQSPDTHRNLIRAVTGPQITRVPF
jgi:hypothetical protein